MTKKKQTPDKMDIEPVMTNKTARHNKDPPSVAKRHKQNSEKEIETKDGNFTVREGKTPEENKFDVSYKDEKEINIKKVFLKTMEHGIEIVFQNKLVPNASVI